MTTPPLDRVQTQSGPADASSSNACSGQSAGQWQPLDEPPRRRRGTIWLPLALLCVVALSIVGALLLKQFHIQASTGTIASIDRGELLLDADGTGHWVEGLVGQPLREGAVLQAMPGTNAVIEFAPGGRLRVESAGEWQILTLRASLNKRHSHTTVYQLAGAASYASRPPQPGVAALLTVRTANATIQLLGVASVVTPPEQSATVILLDGEGIVQAWGEERRMTRSSSITVDPESQSLSLQ